MQWNPPQFLHKMEDAEKILQYYRQDHIKS